MAAGRGREKETDGAGSAWQGGPDCEGTCSPRDGRTIASGWRESHASKGEYHFGGGSGFGASIRRRGRHDGGMPGFSARLQRFHPWLVAVLVLAPALLAW